MDTSFSLFDWIKKSGNWLMRKGSSLARPKFSRLVPEPGVAWTLPKGTATPITPRMVVSIISVAMQREMGLMGLLLEAASSLKGLSTALKGFGKIPLSRVLSSGSGHPFLVPIFHPILTWVWSGVRRTQLTCTNRDFQIKRIPLNMRPSGML